MEEEKEPNETYQDVRKVVVELMQQSEYETAFQRLQPILAYPSNIKNDEMWKDAFGLFKEISWKIAGEELGYLIDPIVRNPDDAEALYDLAYELFDDKLHGIAATLLARAIKIEPYNEDFLAELSYNLEELTMNHDAVRFLSKSEVLLESSELCRYLLGFNSLMTGDVDKARELLLTLETSSEENIAFMATQLRGMVERAVYLKNKGMLDDENLRVWHWILNGSILLHLSPFGLEDSMRGRYAYVSDSYMLCLHGIERLKLVLKSAGLDVPQVIAAPDRSSRILARATAKILDKPIVQWSNASQNNPGLIVVYNWNQIGDEEVIKHLLHHRPGQLVWVHASCWTNPYWYAPDVTTFLYQYNVSPWGEGRLFYDEQEKKAIQLDADESSEEVLSLKICEAGEYDEYIKDELDLEKFILAIKLMKNENQVGLFQEQGERLKERTGSPVRSAQFLL
ncbi:MAG: hypothetical protein JW891_01390 [Candidatus Lokiarchaeota archaeon]|nr:hypothetical protein [Candidatus Lokiarchaeota archaeon]